MILLGIELALSAEPRWMTALIVRKFRESDIPSAVKGCRKSSALITGTYPPSTQPEEMEIYYIERQCWSRVVKGVLCVVDKDNKHMPQKNCSLYWSVYIDFDLRSGIRVVSGVSQAYMSTYKWGNVSIIPHNLKQQNNNHESFKASQRHVLLEVKVTRAIAKNAITSCEVSWSVCFFAVIHERRKGNLQEDIVPLVFKVKQIRLPLVKSVSCAYW